MLTYDLATLERARTAHCADCQCFSWHSVPPSYLAALPYKGQGWLTGLKASVIYGPLGPPFDFAALKGQRADHCADCQCSWWHLVPKSYWTAREGTGRSLRWMPVLLVALWAAILLRRPRGHGQLTVLSACDRIIELLRQFGNCLEAIWRFARE